MNSYSRKYDPAIPDTNLGPPQKRWRDHFAQWVILGILAVFSLGTMMPTVSLAEDIAIDILVVYTENAKSVDTGSNIEDLIGTVIVDVNKSYEDSGITQGLDKVHIKEVTNAVYNDSNRDLETILNDLTTGSIGDVLEWRDQYLADVVVLLVGNNTECGISRQMNGNDPDFESSAFAVVDVTCAKGGDTAIKPYTFAHQLGHLMGCTDNSEKVSGKCSIMNNARVCPRINRWSNACATILNDTAETIANFRSPKPGTLKFSWTSKKVEENVGTVDLEVTRTDGKNGQVSVDVKLAKWSKATAGSDFTFTSPVTLTWEDWDDSPKTITVPIIDDEEIETPTKENAVFLLSNETGGAALAKPKKATITINDNDGANMAFVVDVTGSMGFDDNGIQENGEITLATKAFTRYTQNIVKAIKDGKRTAAPYINMVRFRDLVISAGISNDMAAVQEWIDNLYAAGGEDCPEGSVEAILEAAPKMRPKGKIMLYTDAAPHPGLDIDAVVAELKKKSLTVDVKLSGVCEDTRRGDRTSLRQGNRMTRDGTRDEGAIEIFSRIALETGGSFVYMPEVNDGSDSNGTRYENSIFNSMIGTDEPAVIDIVPSVIPQGSTLDLVLTSATTNFNDSSMLNFSAGITVNELEVVSATQIIANVTVPSSIAPNFYDVNVTTSMGSSTETAEGIGALLIVTPTGEPELLSVAPFTGINGTSVTVNLSGLATHFDETTTVDFGSGITVTDLTVHSPTLLTATIDITSEAQVGLHKVVVETGSQSVEKMNAFLVLSAFVNDSTVSKITKVTPSQGAAGSTLEIEIFGKTANFSDEESVLDFSGTGITVLLLEVTSANHAIATIAIDDEATLGYRDVFMSTGEETATLLNGFEIAADVPEIVQVKPNYASQDETVDIDIIGQNVSFAGESVVNIEGTGVSVLSTTIDSSTQITANIQVEKSAPMGKRNISVTTGTEFVLLQDGFTILAEIAPAQKDPLEELEDANLYLVWGSIFDENGDPIEGVLIKLGEQTATTDEIGFWSIYGIPEGSYTVVAGKKTYTFTSPEVTLGNQEFITEVKILLDSPGTDDDYVVYGVITDADGNPLAGVNVQIGNKTVITDAEGKWEIVDLFEGNYTVVASKEGYTPASKDVTLANQEFRTEVALTLVAVTSDGYTVQGIIVDIFGNKIAGVTVQVGDKQTVTNTEGEWEITGLSEGDYTVVPTKSGYHFISKDITLGDQEVTEVELEPATGGFKAFGTIKDKFNEPMVGVTIQVYSKTEESAEPVATTVTDEDGNWGIIGLFEGGYTVIASKDGYLFKSQSCFVSENQNCEPKLSKPDSLLQVTMNAPKTVKQGENVTYAITVTNMSNGETAQTATGIVITDTLPENTQLVSATPSSYCSGTQCTLPDLEPTASIRVTLVISNNQANKLKNTATVTSVEYPADLQTKVTKVLPYFSAAISAIPNPVQMGGVLQCKVDVELSSNAPSVATGIELEFELPNGVELQSVSSDDAVCDSSNFPTIICAVNELTMGSADSISHTIDVNVEITDLGLLVLPMKATVTANEYPSYTVMEHIKVAIPEGIEVDIAFVIDDSGSMGMEIGDIVTALDNIISEIKSSGAQPPLVVLVTFKDEVRYRAFTQDMETLRKAVFNLKAKGGGNCPEASVPALELVIPHVKEGGSILFTTDAPPYENANVDGIITGLSSKGIRFNGIITGDCDKESSWNNVPNGE